jgi:uncharacterized protein YnzC (UPF0291/DUF896 family)
MQDGTMLERKKMERINELARKAKRGETLSAEERLEQHGLRQEYLARFRESFRAHLDNIEVVDTPEEAERRRREIAAQAAKELQ